jgi:hypothetical protein
LITKYMSDVKEIVLDCSGQSSTDVDAVNMLLSALQIFACEEGITETEWEVIVSKMTEGIPGDIRFRPTVA